MFRFNGTLFLKMLLVCLCREQVVLKVCHVLAMNYSYFYTLNHTKFSSISGIVSTHLKEELCVT